MPRKHKDTRISLHPHSFEDVVKAIVQVPKRTDSEAEGSGSTTKADPESDTSEPRTSRGRTSSDD